MTAEGVDFDISIAFDNLTLTPHQQQLSYLCNHEPIILKAIKEIRSKKKCPDIPGIYDYVMTSTASNTDKESIQTLIDNLIQKDEIFNRKTTQGLDLLFIRSMNKLASVVSVDKPGNVGIPKKNINITSSKTLSKLDKSTPNCDNFTETPALKDNYNSKLNCNISNNVPKSSDSSTLPDTPEPNKSVHEVPHATHQRSAFVCNDYVRKEVFDIFYKDNLEFKHYMNDIIKIITPSSEIVTNLSNDNVTLQTKITLLEEEIESVKNENSNFKGYVCYFLASLFCMFKKEHL